MDETDNKKTLFTIGGGGLFNMMFIVFLTLKLCKVIDWSWWWVTAPLWGPLVLVIVLFIVGTIGVAVCDALTKSKSKW